MGVCSVCTSASQAADPLGKRQKVDQQKSKQQVAAFNAQFKAFLSNSQNYRARMEAMQKLNELLLVALQEEVVLGAEQPLERLAQHVINTPDQDTIEVYSSLEIMNLLCYQVLYEYSLTHDKKVADKINDIMQALLTFYEKEQDEEFLLSAPILHQIRICAILLHNLPQSHEFLKLWFKLITESISIFTKKGDLLHKIAKEAITAVNLTEDIFKVISDVKEAKIIAQTLQISEAIVAGNEEIEVLLTRLHQVTRWDDAMLYLDHLANIVLRLHRMEESPQNLETMDKAVKGSGELPGITTFLIKNPTTGKVQCAPHKIYRKNYPKIAEQIVQSLLIVKGCGYMTDHDFNFNVKILKSGLLEWEGAFDGLFQNIDKLKEDFTAIYGPKTSKVVRPVHLKISSKPKLPKGFGAILKVVEAAKKKPMFDFSNEIEEVQALLQKNRCLSIIGFIGSGKSLFAGQVAEAMKIKPVIWLNFELPEGPVSQLNAIQFITKFKIGQYQAKQAQDLNALGAKVRENLDKNEAYILILPGINEVEFVRGFLKTGPLKKGYLLATSIQPVMASEENKAEEIPWFKLNQISNKLMKEKIMKRLDENEQAADKLIEMCKGKPELMAHLTQHLEQSNYDLVKFVSEDKPIGEVFAESFKSVDTEQEEFIFACIKYVPGHYLKQKFLTFASFELKMDSYDLETFVDDLVTFEYLIELQEQGIYKIDSVMREYIQVKVSKEQVLQLYDQFLEAEKRPKPKETKQKEPEKWYFGSRIIGFLKDKVEGAQDWIEQQGQTKDKKEEAKQEEEAPKEKKENQENQQTHSKSAEFELNPKNKGASHAKGGSVLT